MNFLKKGSKKQVNYNRKKKRKDTLDEDEENAGISNDRSTLMSAADTDTGTKKNSKKLSCEKVKKGKNDKKKDRSMSGKKVRKENFDPNICIAVKKIEESIKNMMAKGGVNTYFEKNLSSYTPPKTGSTAWSDNMGKNRNKDIACYDHSRVKLETDANNRNTYINASTVVFDDFERKYILTQYPLADTLEDFWLMVFQNDVETVLSIFNPSGDQDISELKKKKKKETATKDGSLTMTVQTKAPATLSMREEAFEMTKSHMEIAVKSTRCSLAEASSFFPTKEGLFMTIGRYFVHTRKIENPERNDRPTIYTVEVLPEGCSECKFVRVINYAKWDGRTAPPTTSSVLSLIRAISLDPLQKGPVVVHCDLGVNRSATVVLTDVISNRVLAGKPVDIDEVFKTIRNQRGGAFQRPMYFGMAIYAAVHYIFLRCNARRLVNSETTNMLRGLVKELGKSFRSKAIDEATL